jgi:hypothetical protein
LSVQAAVLLVEGWRSLLDRHMFRPSLWTATLLHPKSAALVGNRYLSSAVEAEFPTLRPALRSTP